METSIYKITLKDGREFRIFCANSTQRKKLALMLHKKSKMIKDCDQVFNGINTLKQFEDMQESI